MNCQHNSQTKHDKRPGENNTRVFCQNCGKDLSGQINHFNEWFGDWHISQNSVSGVMTATNEDREVNFSEMSNCFSQAYNRLIEKVIAEG